MMPAGQNSLPLRPPQDLPSLGGMPKFGLWICQPAKDYLWATNAFCQINGLKQTQIGTSLSTFYRHLHPDDQCALAKVIEQDSDEGGSFDLEVRILAPDANIRTISLRAQALGGEDQCIQIIGTVCEALAPKEQQELARLRNDVRSFIENSPDVVVRLDESGAVLLASRTFANQLRIGSNLNVSLLQHLRDLSKEVLATRAPRQKEHCVELVGRLHWVETYAIPESEPDGKIVSVLTFTRDVTDRKLSEDLLASSKRSLLVAMESMELAHEAAGMGYWDRDTATNAMHWSDRVYTILGRTPGSATPSYEEWAGIVHPEDKQFCEAALTQAYGTTGKYRCQYRIVLPAGSTRWLEENGKLIRDFAGNPTRMIGTITDITDQKEQEQALVHFEKLSSAMRLSSTLAHEMNNPLTAVTYLVHLALQDQELRATTREHLVAAQEELARAAHVASQTLSLDRAPSEKATVNVSGVVRELLSIYRHRLQSKKVEPVARLDEDALALIPANELRQIISNLLVNAMDAAATRGRRVVIRVRNVRASGVTPAVQITVADEGPGIERALRKKVFEPFFTTKGNHGIGLGLWLTRELINRNSGTIAVRSCTALNNSWTAFVMTFPAARAEAVNRAAEKTAGQAA
jgi:PAS domain S-box-containing protein